MQRLLLGIIGIVLPVCGYCYPYDYQHAYPYNFALTKDQIKAEIIKESINDYFKLKKGSTTSCPCPYSTGEDSQTCGAHSAYYLQNVQNIGTDFVIKCYPRDVSEDDVAAFRIEHAIPSRVLNPR